MQKPKFSIIVPVYNVEKFIARAIESAINQSYKDIEIICVDDKSTDESARIIKEFMAKDKRIKLICNDANLGTFATRNKGALSASGEYLLFLDADDMLVLNACERLAKELERYEKDGQSIEILAFNQYDKNKNGEHLYLLHTENRLFSMREFILDIVTKGKGMDWSLYKRAFLRTTYIKSLQNLDLNKRLLLAEDALNFISCLFYAQNYACIRDGLYIWCENENSITQRKDKEKLYLSIENHLYVADKILALSLNFSPFERYFAQICAINLRIAALNERRKLNSSFLNYLATSFQKRLLRFKQMRYARKILAFNKDEI